MVFGRAGRTACASRLVVPPIAASTATQTSNPNSRVARGFTWSPIVVRHVETRGAVKSKDSRRASCLPLLGRDGFDDPDGVEPGTLREERGLRGRRGAE